MSLAYPIVFSAVKVPRKLWLSINKIKAFGVCKDKYDNDENIVLITLDSKGAF